MKEHIVVLKLNEERVEYTMTKQLPKELRDDVFKRIGSEFDQSQGTKSKEIIRGLPPRLERIYLPNLIGAAADSQDFPNKARDFWADYTITPSREGIKLNIATETRTVKINDIDQQVEVPVNVDDYMQYTFARQSSKVASEPDELNNIGFYDFILEDLSEVRNREVAEFEAKDKATLIYARLTSKMDVSINKINFILELTKESSFFDTDMEELDKKMLLRKLAETKPDKLIQLNDDEDLENKAFLSAALAYSIIVKEGNDYYYLNENMGSEERGALSWVKKPEKNGMVAAIKSKLAEQIKNKKQVII